MRYTTFGHRTGLRVSEYALGTGNFGTAWGAGADEDASRRMFDRFAEAGGNFLDTSDNHQFGQSEEILSKLIAADRDHFVLAGKFSVGAEPRADVSRTGNSRKNMIRSVNESLRRLGTDFIDLYWVHVPDDLTPVEELSSWNTALWSGPPTANSFPWPGASDWPPPCGHPSAAVCSPASTEGEPRAGSVI